MQAPEAVRDPPPPRPALAGIAERLIGDLGIVRLAGPANRQAGAPAFFHFWAQAADTGTFVRQRNFAKTGGAATDRDRALAKALGEAVERYCAAIYDREELLLRTAEAAEFAVADPADFALNSTSQYAEPGFRFVPFDSQTPVRWTPATDAVTGAVVSVPAAMVYVPYFYAPGSPGIASRSSTSPSTVGCRRSSPSPATRPRSVPLWSSPHRAASIPPTPCGDRSKSSHTQVITARPSRRTSPAWRSAMAQAR